MTDSQLLHDAVEFARAAGRSTLDWFGRHDLGVDTKADGTPVTEADRHAEQLLRRLIQDAYPDDSIIGEEFGTSQGSSGRTWILDPIDGTKAFTHGVPLYSTLVAVQDQRGIAAGVIDLPALGETVYAGRGLGCSVNGRPAHVSDTAQLDGAYLTTSGFEYWDPVKLMALRESGMVMRTWGDAYGYALVATGRVEAMVDPVANLWDLAPMVVIIPEAGGTFTDLTGTSGAAITSGLATNGRIHDDVLAVVGYPEA